MPPSTLLLSMRLLLVQLFCIANCAYTANKATPKGFVTSRICTKSPHSMAIPIHCGAHLVYGDCRHASTLSCIALHRVPIAIYACYYDVYLIFSALCTSRFHSFFSLFSIFFLLCTRLNHNFPSLSQNT